MPSRKPSISRRRHIALPTHLQTLCPTGEPIVALAFSPTGHFVAAALQHGAIHVLSVAPCTPGSAAPPLYPHPTRVLNGHQSDVLSLAFSPCGTLLASAAMDRDVRLWNPARSAKCLRVLRHDDMATAVAFAPPSPPDCSAPSSAQSSSDGLPAGQDGAPSLQRLRRRLLESHAERAEGGESKAPPAVLLSTSCDGRARAWDAASGALLNAADSGHVLTSVHYVSGSTAALATYDGRVLSWRRPADASRLLGGMGTGGGGGGPDGPEGLLLLGEAGEDGEAMRRQPRRAVAAPRWLRRRRAAPRRRAVALAVAQEPPREGFDAKRTAVAVSAGSISLMRDGEQVARARLCVDGATRTMCLLRRCRRGVSGGGGATRGGGGGGACTGLSDDGRVALVGSAQRGGVRLADLRGVLGVDGRGPGHGHDGRGARADVFTLRVLGRGVETSCAAIAPLAVRKRCGRGGSGPDVVMVAIAGDDGSLNIVEQRLPVDEV